MSSPQETSTSPFSKGGSFIDPAALMAIHNLEFRARVVVEGFWNGLHRSPYHGFSVEFTEYRQYTPGDDTRHLDWRLYARTDRYYLKRFEDETNLRCYLIQDQSSSMRYGSLPYTKADYARTLAATLAWFLNEQGDAVGLFTFSSKVNDYLPARHRHGHLRQLMLSLERDPAGDQTNLVEPLRRIAELIRKRALILLISDLLAPVGELEHRLRALTAAGHEVVIFHVLDPSEVEFRFEKSTLFRDLETQKEIQVDPDVIRPQYQQRLQAHTQAVETLCRKLGSSFVRIVSSQPLESVLFEFLKSRSGRTKVVRRRNQFSGT